MQDDLLAPELDKDQAMTGADGWGLIFEDQAYRESLQRRRELGVEDGLP